MLAAPDLCEYCKPSGDITFPRYGFWFNGRKLHSLSMPQLLYYWTYPNKCVEWPSADVWTVIQVAKLGM